MKIELQRLVDGIWYIYGNYDMSKPHDATAFGEAVSELAKHFNIRTVVSYTDVEKQVEGLENKIADIKANCDLAIEGREVKIKELEEENERLKGDLELWESGGCRATNLFKCGVAKELKEQIEKMKCCGNCRFNYCERSSERIDKDGNRTFHCWNEDKEKYCDVGKNGKYQCWELAD